MHKIEFINKKFLHYASNLRLIKTSFNTIQKRPYGHTSFESPEQSQAAFAYLHNQVSESKHENFRGSTPVW